MIELIVLWSYMAIVCLGAGVGVLALLNKIIQTPQGWELGVTPTVIAGVTALTVYAQVWSIFSGVGMAAHLVMLALVLVSLFWRRVEVSRLFISSARIFLSHRWLIIVIVVVICAFFSSRGEFHTDTKIYHAQAIRLIEEYGLVRGLGNVQLHFAYNSSALAFAALFTMSWLLPTALHGTTGFLMCVLGLYAINGLTQIRSQRDYACVAAKVAILIYILTNLYYAMSPATDYAVLLLTLFLASEWLTIWAGDMPIEVYGLLSIFALFIVSMKLSGAAVVLLAIYPAWKLIRAKKYRQIAGFVIVGFLTFLPYLIRNVLISGWLFYPVSSIDLFNVDWKIPVSQLVKDSAQIKTWGRCLYDVAKVDAGIGEWFGLWWSEKQHYEQMLLYAQVLSTILLVGILIYKKRKGIKLELSRIIYYLMIYASILIWFFTAPFIRYGLAFLLLLPLGVIAESMEIRVWQKNEEDSDLKAERAIGEVHKMHLGSDIVMTSIGVVSLVVLCCFASWIDNYMTDNVVFVKHTLMDEYYIVQKPFDDTAVKAVDLDGLTVYITDVDGENSYYYTPSTCYDDMLENIHARGTSIKDGFRAE